MDYESLWFPAMLAVVMFTAAINPKALGASIVAAVGIIGLYPDKTAASLLTILYIPAVLLAVFRD